MIGLRHWIQPKNTSPNATPAAPPTSASYSPNTAGSPPSEHSTSPAESASPSGSMPSGSPTPTGSTPAPSSAGFASSVTPAGTSPQPNASAPGSVATPTPVPSTRNIGAIVGGAVGGVVGLVVLVALLYFLKVQRRFQGYYWSKKDIGGMSGPVPGQYSDRTMCTFPPSPSSVLLMSVVEGHTGDTASRGLAWDSIGAIHAISAVFRHTRRGRHLPDFPVSPSTYHSDGGVRLAYSDSEMPSSEADLSLRVVDAPPAYGRY
ncbi:hypothetical protein BV25DRAFT_1921843 [Artomyces pyxidatus]|uniref:Uncharacterized protein n=1 Tax=Artomyces pyxidatus TaxID=48021 RepID=A0ACB8SGA9_9AGAM|nr:hypothetical protein BV25DRAFT_1921843 [Artomyces pyxidatus]